MLIQLRPFRAEDAKPCLDLFHETIHRINIRDYAEEQIDAWAPADYDHDTWASRFNDRLAHVACDGNLRDFVKSNLTQYGWNVMTPLEFTNRYGLEKF